LRSSDVGFLVTNRQTTGDTSDAYNRTLGADLNMRLAQYLFVTSYFALTRGPGTGGEAGRLALGWRDRVWNAAAMMRYAGDDFNPGMGFVRRRGIRHWYGTFGAHPRVAVPGVLEINPFAEADYVTNLSGRRETWEGTGGLGVTFRDGGILSLRYADRWELLEQPFPLKVDGVNTGNLDALMPLYRLAEIDPAGLREAGAGGGGGVQRVDVEAEIESRSGRRRGDLEAAGRHAVAGHHMGPEGPGRPQVVLRAHDAAGAELGPAPHARQLREAAHGAGVGEARPVQVVHEVQVGVHLHQVQRSLGVAPAGQRADEGIGDAVVAAQADGEDAARRQRLHRLHDAGVGLFRLHGDDLHVAGIAELQAGEHGAVGLEVVVAAAPLVEGVLGGGLPDGPRPEPGAAQVRSAFVEGDAQDRRTFSNLNLPPTV